MYTYVYYYLFIIHVCMYILMCECSTILTTFCPKCQQFCSIFVLFCGVSH